MNTDQLQISSLNITAKVKGGRSSVVKELSFSVEKRKKMAIVGRSGCGKTMTAMAVMGLLPDNCKAEGSILWKGQELLEESELQKRKRLGREIVLIPQSGSDFLNPNLRIRRQFREAVRRAGIAGAQQEALMRRLLTQMGFREPEEVLKSYPFQLSGGMAQRVIMAMAACAEPELVIADEPTRGIDQDNTKIFLENLDLLFGNAAVLLITHDISVAAACDRILVMDQGQRVEYGESGQIMNAPQELYTRRLIADLPKSAKEREQNAAGRRAV